MGSSGNWQGPCFPRAELWNALESVVTPVSQVPQQLGWHLAEPSAVVLITVVPRHMGERGGARREDEVSVSHWSRHVGLVLTKPTPQWWHLHSSVGEAGFTHYPVFELNCTIVSLQFMETTVTWFRGVTTVFLPLPCPLCNLGQVALLYIRIINTLPLYLQGCREDLKRGYMEL